MDPVERPRIDVEELDDLDTWIRLPWAVFADATDGAVLVDTSPGDPIVVAANAAFGALVDRDVARVRTQSLRAACGPQLPAVVAELRATPRAGPVRAESVVETDAGAIKPVEVELIPLLSDRGGRCMVVVRDLTEQRSTEQRAARAQERLRLATDVGQIGTWEWHPESGELIWDHWLRRILGVGDDIEPSHQLWTALMVPEDHDRAARDARLLIDGTIDEYEARYQIRHGDGAVRHVLARTRVSERDPTGTATCLVGVLLDITVLEEAITQRDALLVAEQAARAAAERANEELARIASTDPLTGLANRNALTAWLTAALSWGETLHVLFVDVDHFKPINDAHSHIIGDEVLVEIGQRLRSQVRDSDIVARFGGDEFVVATVASRDPGAELARRLRAAIRQPIVTSTTTLTVSASIGVASGSQADDDEANTLLANADLALYRAKRDGRDLIVHYNDIDVGTTR